MDLGSSAASAAYQNSSTSLLSGGFNFDISGILTDALNIVSQSLNTSNYNFIIVCNLCCNYFRKAFITIYFS